MGRPHAGTYLVCFEAHCSRSMGAQRALQRPPSAHNILGALLRSLHIYIVIIIRLSAAFMGAAALPAAASAVRREGSWPCGTVLGFEIDPCGVWATPVLGGTGAPVAQRWPVIRP